MDSTSLCDGDIISYQGSMRISVITMSCRPCGLEPVRDALLKQTMSSDEWEWLVDLNWSGKVDFNKASNRLLKRSQGELIVFVQDYVELPPDALEYFWKAHQLQKAFYTAPVSKYDDDGEEWDWRAKKEGEIDWREWEIDCGSAPRDALFEIGGFDEYLDAYWGYDNPNVALRAEMEGYKFYNLPDIRARAYDHNKHKKHEFRHLQNQDKANIRLEMIRSGDIIIDCLTR